MNKQSDPQSRGSRRRRGRPQRRSDQHRTAHAEAEEYSPRPVIDDPLVCTDEPARVDTSAGLAELVKHVRSIGSFAYDTEFVGEESYRPLFCVIQIATPERIAIVDPLADLDVTPVWEMIADPELETVLHAGLQDLEPVVRFLDRAPANIFDTQIAAGFVNLPHPISLRKLVAEILGVRLGKGFSFTRWDQRPLSEALARYAADDVRYLPAVRQRLGERLEALGHTDWVVEECATLSEPALYRFDADSRVERLLSNRSMKASARLVLRELVIVRDRAARSLDRPPRTVLRDDVLIRLAKAQVSEESQLGSIKGLPRPFRQRFGDKVVEATKRALQEGAEPVRRIRTPEESLTDKMRIDSLWVLVSAYCLAHSVDPSLVTNRRQLTRFYFGALNSSEDLESSLESGWRRELIGDLLKDLMEGDESVRFEWRDGQLSLKP